MNFVLILLYGLFRIKQFPSYGFQKILDFSSIHPFSCIGQIAFVMARSDYSRISLDIKSGIHGRRNSITIKYFVNDAAELAHSQFSILDL